MPGPKGAGRPSVVPDERLGECRYGDWTGRQLKTLVKEPLWKVVQQHPSAAVFPGPEGESMRAMQQRALDAMRDWDAQVAAAHGEDAVWVAVSHGDARERVPAYVWATQTEFRGCAGCARLYWGATHREHMLTELATLGLAPEVRPSA